MVIGSHERSLLLVAGRFKIDDVLDLNDVTFDIEI